jgi:hypothetical protein
MQGQTPDDGAVICENVKAKSATFNGSRAENADVYELALVGQTIVEEFLAEKTVKPRDVYVERGQLLPSLSSMVLLQE